MTSNLARERPVYVEYLQRQRYHNWAAVGGTVSSGPGGVAEHRFPVRLWEIWNQFLSIPAEPDFTEPLSNGQLDSSTLVTLWIDRPLVPVSGSPTKFTLIADLPDTPSLVQVITATFGTEGPQATGGPFGTGYTPRLADANGTLIPYDPKVWVLDGVNFLLEFPYGIPAGAEPPFALTFFQYVGTTGGSGGGGGAEIWRYYLDPVSGDNTVGLDPTFPGALANPNLVFPKASTEATPATMLFFDEQKGALRAGRTTTAAWQQANRGANSAAFGLDNEAAGAQATVAGGSGNSVASGASNSTVLGGSGNAVVSDPVIANQDAILAGASNLIRGASVATNNNLIGAGDTNEIRDGSSNAIGAGSDNAAIRASAGFIGAGLGNSLTDTANAAVVAGVSNAIDNEGAATAQCAIVAGSTNHIFGSSVASNNNLIGAGDTNVIEDASASFIGAGSGNTVTAASGAVVVGVSNTVNASPNAAIVAGHDNFIVPFNEFIVSGNSFIGAGNNNSIAGMTNSFIGSGVDNTMATIVDLGNANAIVAGLGNAIIDSVASVIVGGQNNAIPAQGGDDTTNNNCFIGAGQGNQIGLQFAGVHLNCGIVAGLNNGMRELQCSDSVICGGQSNSSNGTNNCFNGAGDNNSIDQSGNSAVVAGTHNIIEGNSDTSFIGAGDTNSIEAGSTSFIGAGTDNTVSGLSNLVGAGESNTANGTTSGVLCGDNNIVSCVSGAVVSGSNNVVGPGTARSNQCAIVSGVNNQVFGSTTPTDYSLIGAGNSNTIEDAPDSFIGAGDGNVIHGRVFETTAPPATPKSNAIVAGTDNTITNTYQNFIGAGTANLITSFSADLLTPVPPASAIVSGTSNTIETGYNCFVGAGTLNTISTNGSNTALAYNSVIVGGQNNLIGGIDNPRLINCGIFVGLNNAIGTTHDDPDESAIVCGVNNTLNAPQSCIITGSGNTIDGGGSSAYDCIINGFLNHITADCQSSAIIAAESCVVAASTQRACIAAASGYTNDLSDSLLVNHSWVKQHVITDGQVWTSPTGFVGDVNMNSTGDANFIVAVDCTTTAYTVTLPTAPRVGQQHFIRRISTANPGKDLTVTVGNALTDVILLPGNGLGVSATSYDLTGSAGLSGVQLVCTRVTTGVIWLVLATC